MEPKLKVIVDTDILIKAYRGNETKIRNLNSLQNKYCISVVTAAELIAGAKSIKRLASMDKMLKVYPILYIDEIVSRKTLQFYRKYIIKHELRLPDCFIAATAIQYKLKLYTDNINDYSFIKGISFYKEH